MSNEIPSSQMTHVIVGFDMVPSFDNILKIESILRNDLNHQITCIFHNDPIECLGILVPNPYGFHPITINKPKYPRFDDMKKLVDIQISNPFSESIIKQIKLQIQFIENNYQQCEKNNKYNVLYDLVEQWSRLPISPDKSYQYNDYLMMVEQLKFGGPCRINYALSDEYNLSIGKKERPIMSYNDRIGETVEITKLVSRLEGCICFKIHPGDDYINYDNIPQLINDYQLSSDDSERSRIEYYSNNKYKIGYIF